jgi:hypothetical protein
MLVIKNLFLNSNFLLFNNMYLEMLIISGVLIVEGIVSL